MPRPTARVLALLETLQGGGRWTVTALADRLEVDERTVRRYVRHLLDLGVPVRSVRGRYGGYEIGAGFRLPPLMLTEDEAVAVMLGLLLSRRLAPSLVPDETASAAAAKIRRVLPEQLGRRVAALLHAAQFTAPADDAAGAVARSLLLVADAIAARCPVAVQYTDRHGESSERVLHPYGLVVHSRRWYVVAGQPTDDRVRNFRLDRIERPALRPGLVIIPDGFDPVGHVTAGLVGAPWQHDVRVLVQGAADDVLSHLPARLATIEPVAGEPAWVRLQLRAEQLDWVAVVLAGIRHPFLVEGPEELRHEVAALGRRMLAGTAVPGSVARGSNRGSVGG